MCQKTKLTNVHEQRVLRTKMQSTSFLKRPKRFLKLENQHEIVSCKVRIQQKRQKVVEKHLEHTPEQNRGRQYLWGTKQKVLLRTFKLRWSTNWRYRSVWGIYKKGYLRRVQSPFVE